MVVPIPGATSNKWIHVTNKWIRVTDWYGVSVKAPPVEGQQWFNAEPIVWDELLGRVVVLVFWGAADEASLARIAQVQELSALYPNLASIGIHTPRLPYEDDADNVASIIGQYNITIPIVHDPEYVTWNRYNPDGWPTTLVIDDRLNAIGVQAGVDYFETLKEAVWLAVSVADKRQVGQARLPLGTPQLQPVDESGSPLRYPSCVRAISDNELVVVDSGHDRLLIAEVNTENSTARVTATIDGFDSPGAIAVPDDPKHKDKLFVSEPANGSIIRYDRSFGTRFVLTDQLIRPTGLSMDYDGSLVVADSASEQLLRIPNPYADQDIQLGLIAGNGMSGSEDGTSTNASLAQPTAFARTEVGMVFCDAAASSLRLLTDSGKITTIIGDEFEWGHVDGPAHQARLQRPSDLAILGDGSIIIVDTGNGRLRRLSKRRVATVGPEQLNRATSVCVMPSGHVIVAETGSDQLIFMNSTLKSATPLELEGLADATSVSMENPASSESSSNGQTPPGTSLRGLEGEQLAVSYPSPSTGPWNVSVHSEPSTLLTGPISVTRNSSAGKVQVTLGSVGNGQLIVRSDLIRDSTVAVSKKWQLAVTDAEQSESSNLNS